MNDEAMGMFPRKRGPKPGSANETEPLMWQGLLGDFAQDLIEEAHEDIEAFRKGELK